MTRLVGRGECGYSRDAGDGMVAFRCIRYRLVKLQVEYIIINRRTGTSVSAILSA
jgi:hypothetical protein